MITLKTPNSNTKWKNIKTGHVFPGNLILGIHDSPANYELVDISEYEEQVKKEEEENKKAELEAMKAEEEEMKKAKEEARKAKEAMKKAKPISMLRQINGGKKSWQEKLTQ